ncbi:MAG: hypothetical protein O7G32_10570, partial [SAR324 cluster bacterium]|nr:hypothetical protein [SAR324 cluster bacterium]
CMNTLEVESDGSLHAAVVNDTAHLMEEFPHTSPGQRWLGGARRWELLGEPSRAAQLPEA